MKKKLLTNKLGKVRELTQNDLHAMRPACEVLPENLFILLPKRKRGERGLQKHPKKISITLRYSPEVVKYFKNIGSGWQISMDEALKEWIKKHPRQAA
jgi:uncharacterized protein (DUF4415 family)